MRCTIDASLQTVETYLLGSLVVGYGRGVQVDGDRLLQVVRFHNQQECQSSPKRFFVELSI